MLPPIAPIAITAAQTASVGQIDSMICTAQRSATVASSSPTAPLRTRPGQLPGLPFTGFDPGTLRGGAVELRAAQPSLASLSSRCMAW